MNEQNFGMQFFQIGGILRKSRSMSHPFISVKRAFALGMMALCIIPSGFANDETGREESVIEASFQTFFYEGNALERDENDEVVPADVARPELFYQDGDQFPQVSLGRNRLGLKHRFRGVPPFRFYREEMVDEEKRMVPVAALPPDALQSGGHYVILMEQTGADLRLQAVEAGGGRVDANEILLLNASSRRVAAQSDAADPTIIPPGESRSLGFETGDDYRFSLKIASEQDEGWELIRSTRVTQVGDRALFMIIYPDARRENRWHTRFLRLQQ